MPDEPLDLPEARRLLGVTQDELARDLGLGKHGGRTVRKWEAERKVPGPAEVAVRLMLLVMMLVRKLDELGAKLEKIEKIEAE